MTEAGTVCVVIPTFNRRDELLLTLDGVRQQTRPVDHVIVYDNASEDETASAVRARYAEVEVVRADRNTGSAGGFGRGAQEALERGFDWIWLLDNDSIPSASALEELLSAYARFSDGPTPTLLATKVEWKDGSILPLNVPIFKRKELDSFYRAADKGTLSLRAAPYAGILVHRSAIERHGLPIEEYFLWNDDIEWTGRLLREDLGVLVPRAVISHLTPGNPTTTADLGDRFYYEVRNKLWLIGWSDAYRPMEKVRFFLTLLVDSSRHILRTSPWWNGLRNVARGAIAGVNPPASVRRR